MCGLLWWANGSCRAFMNWLLGLLCPSPGSLVRIGGGRCSASFPSHLRQCLVCRNFLSTSLHLALGTLTPSGSSLAANPRHPLGKSLVSKTISRLLPRVPCFSSGLELVVPHFYLVCYFLLKCLGGFLECFGLLLCEVLTVYYKKIFVFKFISLRNL